jgi:hypothetical protein
VYISFIQNRKYLTEAWGLTTQKASALALHKINSRLLDLRGVINKNGRFNQGGCLRLFGALIGVFNQHR